MRNRGAHGGWLETVSAGQRALRGFEGHRNSTNVRLGVKWSQVQILSARPKNQQFRGSFGVVRDRLLASEMGVDSYAAVAPIVPWRAVALRARGRWSSIGHEERAAGSSKVITTESFVTTAVLWGVARCRPRTCRLYGCRKQLAGHPVIACASAWLAALEALARLRP
jgi:hypothetical protein